MSKVEKGKRKQDNRSPQTDYEQGKEKRKMGNDLEFDVCERLSAAMDDYKLKVSTTLTAIEMVEEPTTRELRTWMMTMAKNQVGGLSCIANIVSDVVEEMHCIASRLREKEQEVEGLKEELAAQANTVSNVVKTKEKIEIKASRRIWRKG